jgi:uncharacterized protein (DUF2267 family)
MDAMRQIVRGAGAVLGAVGDALSRAGRNMSAIPTPGGRSSDPNVSDDVLADRVRSAIGPIRRKLDVPRVHVMVEDHAVLMHGEVDTEAHARVLEEAAMRVPGVVGVESHLHVGLIPGDTRPSDGAATTTSHALVALLDAASAGGAHDARAAVHAVLCGFGDRLPEGERAHLFAHLPADVRVLAGPPHRLGSRPVRARTLPQLVAHVIAQGGIEPTRAERITRLVLARVRELAPEESRDVAATLPDELRDLWQQPVGHSA